MPTIFHRLRASWLLATWCWVAPATVLADVEISPSAVYSQAVQIEKEIELLKRHYKITAHNPVEPIRAELNANHVWQKCYVIQAKLNVLRRKHGLPGIAPLDQEPSLKISPRNGWGQVQRALNEIRIFKAYTGIPGEVSPPTPVSGKRPIDVFNKLNQIAYEMDALNGEPISPSYVYSEVIRLDEDVNAILRKTGTVDNAVLPAKNPEAKPRDSLDSVFALLTEIQRLQRQLDIPLTDLSVFHKKDKVVPADVFNMVTLCVGELRLVKFKLGMRHSITPAAEYHEGKTPAEVVQLLGYVTHKLHRVKVK